jgi:hypothetical protein
MAEKYHAAPQATFTRMQREEPSAEPRWAQSALRFLPWAIWAFLLAFAWRFADERLYSDSGYYLSRVINEGSFRIEHGRWVLALGQLLPLIGVKLGLSMKALILLHSLNNVLWLGACMLFAGRVLRDRTAVLALACVHVIGLTHGLFCPIFELYYGVDLLILFHSSCRSTQLAPTLRWTLLVLFFLGAITSHFFGMLLAVGMLAIERIWRDRRMAMVLAGLLIGMLIVRALTLSVYERSGLEFLSDFLDPAKLLALISPARLGEFITYLTIHYADVFVLSLLAAIVLLRQGQRWTALSFFAMLVLVHVLASLFLPGFIHDRYREQVNFATTTWVIAVWCFHVLPLLRWKGMALALLIAAAGFRMVRAEWIAPWYEQRTALTEARIDLAHTLGMQKAIVHAPVYFGPPHHLIDLSWSTSVESLLLSAKEGPQSTVSLITTQDLDLPEVRAQLDRFIFRRWDILDPSWLDARYFQAPKGRYVPLPGDPAP